MRFATVALCVAAVGCAPAVEEPALVAEAPPKAQTPRLDPQEAQRQRLAAVESEIESFQSGPNADEEFRTEGINRRIADLKGSLAGLAEELRSRRATVSEGLRMRQLRQGRRDALLRATLDDLSARLQAVERVLSERLARLADTAAPASSDLGVSLRRGVARAQEDTDALRERYIGLLTSQQAAIESDFSDQDEFLRSSLDAQVELAQSISDARAEITELEIEKARVLEAIALRKNRLRALQQERKALLKKNQEPADNGP